MELWRASSNRADFSCPAYEFPMVYTTSQGKRERRKLIQLEGHMSAKYTDSWYKLYPYILRLELYELYLYFLRQLINLSVTPLLLLVFRIQRGFQKAPLRDLVSEDQTIISALSDGSPTSKSRLTCQSWSSAWWQWGHTFLNWWAAKTS